MEIENRNLFFLVFLCIAVFPAAFHPNPLKLRLLDWNATFNNFLIRGDYPGSDLGHKGHYHIDYDFWKLCMRELIEKEAKVKLDSFYIVDICLLHHEGEDEKRVNAERAYFEKNPKNGEFVYHEINGTNLNATEKSEEEREKILDDFDKFDKDKLQSLMVDVREMVHSQQTNNTVIYWHCRSGVDRTGEVSGSYMMQFNAWTFKYAYDYNTKVKEGKHMTDGNAKMMNWYCLWLEKTGVQKKLECDQW